MSLVPGTPGPDLSGATLEEIKDFLASLSADERQNVMEALKIVEGGGSPPGGGASGGTAKLASSYIMQATDHSWGFYLMEVKVNSDGTGTVKEQQTTTEESPEVTEIWTGKFTPNGDIIIFKGTEVEMMSDTGRRGGFTKETKAGDKEYCFQKADEGRLLHLGEDGTPLDCPYPLKEGEKKYIYPNGGEVEIGAWWRPWAEAAHEADSPLGVECFKMFFAAMA